MNPSPTGDTHSYEGAQVLETLVNALDGTKLNESLQQEENREHDQGSADEEDGVNGGGEGQQTKKKKKKKGKSKGKSKIKEDVKLNRGAIPDEEPAPPSETEEDRKRWDKELQKGYPTVTLPPWGLLQDRFRPVLSTFLTPACKRLELRTPRLRLRQVESGDLTAVRRIKMEPVVQKTQLYGSPSMSDIKDSFLNRYVRSSMPRASLMQSGRGRDEFIFAITAVNPSDFEVKPPGNVRITNRISSAEGYLGNIALSFTYNKTYPTLMPKKGEVYTQPTFSDMDKAGVQGKMFYEIHPQLWGQGIMSEAFDEVLRFGLEEVGLASIACDPTTLNDASIRLCTKNGLKHTKTVNNEYNRPQMFHEITREEWWARHRPGVEITDRWGGKEVCRWCMNFRLAPPTIQCGYCDWAKYCSRECQRADWVRAGGHQGECDMK